MYMSNICSICNKSYSCYQSLWRHTKTLHKDNVDSGSHIVANGGKKVVIKVTNNVNNKKEYKCNKCDKIYYNKYSKYKHQKICANIVKDLIAKIDMMEEEIKNNAKIIKNNTQITKSNNNKINNGVINHITINKMADEKYLNLSDENIKLIFSKEIESVFTFVELLNFNKEMPENHNHCVTNFEGSYVNVFNTDTKTVQVDQKKYFFDTLLCKSIDRMEILFKNNKKKFNSSNQNEIKTSIDTLKRLQDSYYNKKLFNDLIDKLTLIAYNNKNIVLDTWTDKPKKEYNFREDLESTTHEEFLAERKKRLGNDYKFNGPINFSEDDDSDS